MMTEHEFKDAMECVRRGNDLPCWLAAKVLEELLERIISQYPIPADAERVLVHAGKV